MIYEIFGATLSPFTRKALVVLEEKGLPYSLTFMPPGGDGSEGYEAISPLGKIPAMRFGDRALCDSAIICSFLEREHPEPALYPTDAYDYACALWYEEYADSALMEAVSPVFYERVVVQRIMKQEPNLKLVEKVLTQRQPAVFDHLDRCLEGREYLVGDRFSIADIAVATMFPGLDYAGEELDAERWPNLSRFIAAALARPSFQELLEQDQAILKAL